MGLYTITCPSCNLPHYWFSGNTADQRCMKCRETPKDVVKEDRMDYQQAHLDGLNKVISVQNELIAFLKVEIERLKTGTNAQPWPIDYPGPSNPVYPGPSNPVYPGPSNPVYPGPTYPGISPYNPLQPPYIVTSDVTITDTTGPENPNKPIIGQSNIGTIITTNIPNQTCWTTADNKIPRSDFPLLDNYLLTNGQITAKTDK